MQTDEWMKLLSWFLAERIKGADRKDLVHNIVERGLTSKQFEHLMFCDFLVTFYPDVAADYITGSKKYRSHIEMAVNAWQTRADFANVERSFQVISEN